MKAEQSLSLIKERREFSRRSFVKGTLLAPVALVLGEITLGSQPVSAIPVAALLVVAQAAVAVARLFSPAGPGLEDILAQQTEMLLAMYKQLEVVQAKLDEVIARLGDIQQELGQLPDKTVKALNESTIKSLPRLYKELRNAYVEDAQKLGIVRAREVHTNEFRQTILNPLTLARTMLLDSDSPVNVPVLALALHVEIGTRIILEDTFGRISSALTEYDEWFTGQRTTLRKKMQNSRLYRGLRDGNISQDMFCVQSRSVDESQRYTTQTAHNEDGRMIFEHIDRGERGTTRCWDIRVERREYEVEPVELAHDLVPLVGLLESDGWLDAADRPMRVRQAISNPQVANICKMAISQDWRSNNPGLVPASPDSVQRAEKEADCDKLDAVLKLETDGLSRELTDSGFTLLQNAALLTCVSKALQAIENLRKVIERENKH